MTKFQVYNIINFPNVAVRIPVRSPEDGARLIHQMAKMQLEDERIESNVFGIEYLNEYGGWEDWYDDDGGDERDLADSLGLSESDEEFVVEVYPING